MTALPEAETRARTSLRWDAAYCLTGGVAAIAFSDPLASHLEIPFVMAVVIGAVAAVWGALLWALSRRPGWRGAAVTAGLANLAAGVGIASWAALHSGDAGALLGLIALHVLGFAIHQLWTARGV